MPIDTVAFAPPRVEVSPLTGGGMILRSPQPLRPYARCVGEWLVHWAREAPGRVFLQERGNGGWRRVSYGEAYEAVRRIGRALIDRGLSVERPVAVLSDNGVDHALLALGAMHVGVPVAAVSVAYSLMSRDHERLRQILGSLEPGLIFAADAARFAPAIAAAGREGVELVASRLDASTRATPLESLLAQPAGAREEAAHRAVGPDTVAKILFSSGSTGTPKGIVNTQRMLCSNQQAILQVWPFLERRPPCVVDWLPWSHTFGANHNFNMVLRHGGTLAIDDGKPTPALIEQTVANLREVSPTLYFNVPRGFDMLLPYLERDPALRDRFFGELDLLFYAGAALPQNLWTRLEELSVRARGRRVAMVSAWGSTETSPCVTTVHFPLERAGNIGLPLPGCEVKLVPSGSKLELRVRGPNVMPGYWKRADLTREAFDEDGFYCIGDAGMLADPADASRGIVFDGRIAEDFKLTSGTWVHVGGLRLKVIEAAAPVLQDAVIAGHGEAEIGVLGFPNVDACRSLCPDLGPQASPAALIADPRVRAHVASALARLAAGAQGSSTCPARALLTDEPASIDANEITDKGYINQRAVLERRAALVRRLYAEPIDAGVILPAPA